MLKIFQLDTLKEFYLVFNLKVQYAIHIYKCIYFQDIIIFSYLVYLYCE